MRLINTEQLKKLHTLLGQAGLRDHKAELVSSFTNGRSSSSKDLRHDEAAALMEHLEAHVRVPALNEGRDRMVKKLFFLAYEMGYDNPRNELQARMDRKAVVKENLQGWLSGKHCKINKLINNYTDDELQQVLSQFEAVHKSFMNAYKHAG